MTVNLCRTFDKDSPYWPVRYLICDYLSFLLSAFLGNCFLCWDRWNGDVMPTLDAALLCSSRAGLDPGRESGLVPDSDFARFHIVSDICPPVPNYLNGEKPFLTLSVRYCNPEQGFKFGLQVSVYLNLTHALNHLATTAGWLIIWRHSAFKILNILLVKLMAYFDK